ncbi:MAG: ADP-ribosylglycohydrolase family protein [Chlorobiales bacterium]|nr:ADP-ribosylglycohydrolase family protein [Chlorobiales bacterium]
MSKAQKRRDFLIGTLIGDALALPVNKRPHHIIRTYFKGIKGYSQKYHAAEKPVTFRLGQNSVDPRPILARLPIDFNDTLRDWLKKFVSLSSSSVVTLEKFYSLLYDGHLSNSPTEVLNHLFKESSARKHVQASLQMFPPDMIMHFDEAMNEHDAVLFAMAMVIRNPSDFETTVLSTINMGGLTTITGAITGGALALINGMENIPRHLITSLEYTDEIIGILNASR